MICDEPFLTHYNSNVLYYNIITRNVTSDEYFLVLK